MGRISRDLLKDILPEHMRRLLADRAREAEELYRHLAPSIRAAESAVKRLGPLSLHEDTLRALKAFEPPPIDVGAVARMGAEIERQAVLFRGMEATLARALEVPAFLRGLNLPTRRDAEAGQQQLIGAAETLAKAGWTFSMHMAAADVMDLAEQDGGVDAAKLDEWFLAYYAADRGREFRALTRRLLRKKRLETWRGLLREALWSYRHGKYRIVVPALLLTIEGMVFEVTGTIREKGVNAAKQWRERAAKPPKGFMVEVEWYAVAAFLESLWARSDFGGPDPGSLNRHRVLHGRRPEVGDRADALRLLAAVDFISEAAQNVETLIKRLEAVQRKRRAA
jgi:hypothetical protein